MAPGGGRYFCTAGGGLEPFLAREVRARLGATEVRGEPAPVSTRGGAGRRDRRPRSLRAPEPGGRGLGCAAASVGPHGVSVQEMRKDHEEQLQRLKRLKDQEIDAVTSATSHTRTWNGVIEQMEKFSSNLHDLSHKVEATHHITSQELAMGARQRDKQLKVLQDRLSQQQRDMEEERSRLQEVIAKMEARLGEQARLLEQERWRATAEQSKVESLQHSLEEQR
ncbi:fas-binding factor 1 homolog [Balearica regulorum gibbericeps]|uniref:fas-binding factor 1 homolog n=1 Tax=Balearica regulorum gibbericeps TaxID=100784 RepID=UPI003F633760